MPMLGREGGGSDSVSEGWRQYSGAIVEYGHGYLANGHGFSAIKDTQRTWIFDFTWLVGPCKIEYTRRAGHVNSIIEGTGAMYIQK
jgi:hypothetical protein